MAGAVYLYDAVRSPRGKARAEGGLAMLAPHALVAQQCAALAARCGPAAHEVDGLLLGCVTQSGDQGGHVALAAKLNAGLPDRAMALTINNYCVSGLSAVGQAAALVASGQARAVLAGGVEMMSRVPFMADRASYYSDPAPPPRARFIAPVLAADRLAYATGITRAELDAVALASQLKAAMAEGEPGLHASRIGAGRLTAEECIRPGTTAESLALAEPAFAALQESQAAMLDGARFPPLHTIAHAPPVCDGAALALLGGGGLGPAPRARILAHAQCGGDPVESLGAGMAAMDLALARAGLGLGDIDRIEFMEAFAVTIARFLRDRAPDPARVNVSGGHLAKGHPMGATGGILLSTLLDCLDHCQGRYGLVVATGAMGVGAAMVVERLVPGNAA